MGESTAGRTDAETLLAQAGWVRALALRLVRDDGGADDVVQDTFVAALERPPREDVPLRPWLARVARNFALRTRRGDERRTRRQARAAVPVASRPPDEVAARTECFRDLVDAVLALEPVQREAVLLRYFEGLGAADVAARLGVPEETVRTRLKRAVATLRARLDTKYGDRRAWAVLLVPLGSSAADEPGTPTRRGRGTGAATRLSIAAAGLVLVVALVALLDGDGTVGVPARSAGKTTTSRGAEDRAGAAGKSVAAQEAPRLPRGNRAAAPVAGDRMEDAPPASAGVVRPPAFVVRVVDGEDRPVREGELRIRTFAQDEVPPDARGELDSLPASVDLAAANPYRSPTLAAAAVGTTIEVSALPRDGPPTDVSRFTLSGDAVEEVRIVVLPARTIRVQVVESGTGEPVADALVWSVTEAARREIDPSAMGGQVSAASALTDAEGTCVLTNLGAGTHRLRARAAGRSQRLKVWSNYGDFVVRIELDPSPPGTVVARCTWLDGTPSAGDHVHVGDDGGVTGADGTLVIEDVPAGEHELFLMEQMIGKTPLGQAPSERTGVWIGIRPFTIAPGERLEVGVGYVRGDGTVTVEVVDAAGRPQYRVRVELVEPGIRTADTSPDGVATFREVPDGALRFQVIRGEDRPQWMWTEAAPLGRGESRRLRVVLADAELTGTVATDGTSLPDDTQAVLDGPGLHPHRTPAAGGAFAFREVPAGRYWLRAEASGLVGRPREVVVGEGVGEGAVPQVGLTLGRGGLLLFDPSVRSARLVVSETESIDLAAEGRAVEPAWGEPRGVVAGPFAAGTLRLVVSGADGRMREIDARVEDGETRTVTLPQE